MVDLQHVQRRFRNLWRLMLHRPLNLARRHGPFAAIAWRFVRAPGSLWQCDSKPSVSIAL